jgi:ABC-2 type transport system permease protein
MLKNAPLDQVANVMNELLETQGYNIIQMFANMIGFIMAMIAAIPILLFVLKAKSEETAFRAELILATKTSRTKYLTGFVVISFVTAILFQITQALGMYSMAMSMGFTDKLPLGYLIASTLVYTPALWVIAGLATLLVGLIPRFASWVWAYYGFTFFIMMYGRLLPDLNFLVNFTPMGWVPQFPVDDINWVTMIVLSAVGIALSVLGIIFYNKRDINTINNEN